MNTCLYASRIKLAVAKTASLEYIDNKHLPDMVGFLLKRSSQGVVKKQAKPKVNKVKATLGKRLNISPGNKLGSDVKMPKWLKAIGAYFKGAVHELTLVKWPTRRATWGFTVAVILFTVVLSAFILGLDYGFEQLFKKVIL